MKIVTIWDRGEDRSFLITEMAARPAERWARRLFSRLDRKDGRESMSTVAHMMPDLLYGSALVLAYDLFDELLRDCVRFVPDITAPEISIPLVDADDDRDHIRDVSTRQLLRYEALELHVSFFRGRRPLELDSGGLDPEGDIDVELVEYPNVPATIAVVLSNHPEMLRALDEDLGVEDLYDLIEVMRVDAHNKRLVRDSLRDRER